MSKIFSEEVLKTLGYSSPFGLFAILALLAIVWAFRLALVNMRKSNDNLIKLHHSKIDNIEKINHLFTDRLNLIETRFTDNYNRMSDHYVKVKEHYEELLKLNTDTYMEIVATKENIDMKEKLAKIGCPLVERKEEHNE